MSASTFDGGAIASDLWCGRIFKLGERVPRLMDIPVFVLGARCFLDLLVSYVAWPTLLRLLYYSLSSVSRHREGPQSPAADGDRASVSPQSDRGFHRSPPAFTSSSAD
jgi:hypothetical protein